MFWWKVSTKAGPRAIERRSAVAVGSDVYFFTARGIGGRMEVHVFNTVSCRWTKLRTVMNGRYPPRKLCGHTAVGIETTFYIWGGQYYDTRRRQWTSSQVLYAFDVDHRRWSKPKVSGTAPPKTDRREHAACVLGKAMYVYGAIDSNGQMIDYLHKLDTSTMVWSAIYTGDDLYNTVEQPYATIIGTKMFVFSVQSYDYCRGYKCRIRVFDTGTGSWLGPQPDLELCGCHLGPRPDLELCGCHLAFAYNGKLYVLQSYGYTPQSYRLWKLNPETLSWKKDKAMMEGPSLKNKVGCCVVGDRVVVFHSEPNDELYMLYLSPSLKKLCKLAVIRDGIDRSTLPYNVRWELTAMVTAR